MRQFPNFTHDLDKAKKFILSTELCKLAVKANLPEDTEKIIASIIEIIHTLSLSCHLQEFTDHGLPHIVSLINRANMWTGQDRKHIYKKLSSYEAALLVIGLLIHDIGMLSQNPIDLEGDSGKGMLDIASWVRKTHCARIPRLLERLISKEFPSFAETDFFRLAIRIK